MQSDLGRQKRDKRPLISSVPPPTVSFCRLQGLVSSWQLNGLGSQLHRDPLIPMGTLSPPRAGCLSAPHSTWETPRLPGACFALPHPPRLSYPHVPIRLNCSWKRSPCPPGHQSHLPQCNPAALGQSRTHERPGCQQTYMAGRAVSLRCTSACGS